MNGVIVVSLISFLGPWCDAHGNVEAIFTPSQYVAPAADMTCLLTPKSISKKTIRADYLKCKFPDNPKYIDQNVNIKFTINQKGVMEWYTDRYGTSSPDKQLIRCPHK